MFSAKIGCLLEVFVCTGEVLRMALEAGDVEAKALRCVVFDEVRRKRWINERM